MISLYSVLGLEENSASTEVETAHARLVQAFKSAQFSEGTTAHEQAGKCVRSIENAFQTLKTPELRRLYVEQRSEYLKGEKRGDTRPRLGQLCVASGMISMEQLREAVEEQIKNGMQLGEVLIQKKFISAAQLDGLLLGQEMIDVPSAVTEPTAVKLISLGLLTEDMGLIAQMEHRSLVLPIADIVARHGWVERDVLKILVA
ncbi:MAG TPA: hypothetical protein V6C81_25175 [Planktothrix sp.]|jgi:hypothetical protein